MSSEFLEALQAACESSDASLEFLDALDPPDFLGRLIEAEAADSDFKLTIPGLFPLANAVIQKFSEARLAVTGKTFDAAWSVVAFNFDYSVLGGEVFQPAMFSNGAILIRNHHRVIGIDDRPLAILKVHPRRLVSDLKRLFRGADKREVTDAFFLHRTDKNRVVRQARPPRQLSACGQTLALIAHDLPVDKCKALPADILESVRAQSRTGHAVLRFFGDHVFVYPTHRFSDDLDVLLEEYAETYFPDAESGMPLGVEISGNINSLNEWFSERTDAYLRGQDFAFPDATDVMHFHVAQKTTAQTWSSFSGRKVADVTSLPRFFADRADRPVNYSDAYIQPYSDFERLKSRLWDLSARLKHDMFVVEVPFLNLIPEAAAASSTDAAQITRRLDHLKPFARTLRILQVSEAGKTSLVAPASWLKKSGFVARFAEAVRAAEADAVESGLDGEAKAEHIRETLSHDDDLRLQFVFQKITFKQAIDFRAVHEALIAFSAECPAGIVWHFPRFGLIQSYWQGELDSGNQDLFCLTGEPPLSPDDRPEADDTNDTPTLDEEAAV
ncbi:hypothetical protein [Hyphomonas sp.]|uniref:hypothetical protein n=1 Tax=Hyphomonas sp. TaxID=87 RepID=UPI0025B9E51C|nr:hypothetical protein [Hyphomonas sp.]